ncbi:MAG: FeoA family protein [Cyclobacteriaceae bacterium]|nr:FeoA family protein [Cyclobacteriaceae bacterium]
MFGIFKKTSQEIISGSKKILSELIPGQRASIDFIDENCQGIERNRLLDLGFVPGAQVEVAISSPFNDPTAYLIKGGLIALRRNQASKIHISPLQ